MALASPSAGVSTVNMTAPGPYWSTVTRFHGTITADAFGNIYNVPIDDRLSDLTAAGCDITSFNPSRNFRNVLHGGDFSVNPWQRNVPGWATAGVIAAAITNTPTYLADRWFGVGGASSSLLLSKITNATAVAGSDVALQLSRTAGNANTAPLYIGQVIDNRDVIALQGQTVTLSFWAAAGALFSAANSLFSVQLFAGTGVRETATSMVAGTWTGTTNPINASGALGSANPAQVISSVWQRYSFTGVVPTTATELGVLIGFTPVGTAGATDYVQFMSMQLEIGTSASSIERRSAATEAALCQTFAWAIAEPAAGVTLANGMNTTANVQQFIVPLPVPMFRAPIVGNSAAIVGSFKTMQLAVATATATLAYSSTVNTPNAITLVTASISSAAGAASQLIGGGGAGYIFADADFH